MIVISRTKRVLVLFFVLIVGVMPTVYSQTPSCAGSGQSGVFSVGTSKTVIFSQGNLQCKKNTDGIYDSDPNKNPDAKKFDELTHLEVIEKDLKVMDVSAVSLCKDNNIPLFVFDFEAKDGITKILQGENIGTYIGE